MARASRFVRDRDREVFIASHKALRRLVGDAHHRIGPHGKPHVPGVSFNLSHSGELALVAVAPPQVDVGVDVEQVVDRDLDLVAPTVFSQAELRAFASAPDKSAAFFRAWTRKEAFLKMLGVGISVLRSFDVSMQAETRNALLESRVEATPRSRIVPLAIDPGYEAALATTDLVSAISVVREDP